ncbi:MAG: tetratricopeptide repeat-containing diguanylate cyclase [Trueperaceae bacterium]
MLDVVGPSTARGDGILFDIDTLNDAAWSLRDNDPMQALELAQQAYVLAQNAHDDKGLAYSLITKSFAHFRFSKYRQALELGYEAFELLKILGDNAGQQRILNNLAIIYADSGELTEALRVFLQNQAFCEAIKDISGEAQAFNNIAIVYGYLGDHVNSLECHLKSLNLSRQIGSNFGEMKSLVNIASLYLEQDKGGEALEYLEQSLKLRTDDDLYTYAVALSNMARAYRNLGDYLRALEYGQQSLDIFLEQLSDPANASYTLNELGNNHALLGNSAEAEAYYQRSLHTLHTTGERKGEAETSLLLAKLLQGQEHIDEAIGHLHHARKLAQDIGALLELSEAHLLLATLYQRKGLFEGAYQHLEQHVLVKEKLSSDSSKRRFEALRVKFEVEQTEKEKELYRLRTVELAEMNSKLETLTQELFKQANEDPLTGLFNRRRLEQELTRELERARRTESSLSVMICDIDNFKQVNDRFSHQVGDFVLTRVGQILKRYVRGADVIARYGGEEFVILFPDASAKEAQIVCDRLRQKISTAPWHDLHPDLTITLSMGICDDISLVDGFAMIDQADDKLYEAKRNGKNQVRI